MNSNYHAPIVSGAKYKTHNSQLVIHVLHVRYQNDRYAKIKYALLDSKGAAYEQKNAKVYKSFITHWEMI